MTERKDHLGTHPDPGVGLDDFFTAARATSPVPDVDFLAQLTQDALKAQPRPRSRVAQPGLWQQFKTALGGWPGVAGLATACAVGLWIGVNPPAGISDYLLVDQSGGELGFDPMNGFDLIMMEG
ncbi:MAG: hypothetical protein N4A61_09515 [Pelagimonas sp.]|jgi:hypothetical protein|nr:hypothetical protein [Pelagimonas sp.]